MLNGKLKHLNLVLDILEKHDPMQLMNVVTREEYSIEAIDIANRAGAYDTITDYSLFIKTVFDFWFYEDSVSSLICEAIATDIKNKINTGKE